MLDPTLLGHYQPQILNIITDASGTIRDVIEKFKRGELKKTDAPTVGGHFGSETEQGRRP